MAQMVLREFLLAVERSKQPLDAAIQSFAQAFASDDGNALATKFLEIQPHADALLHTWPDTHGAGSRWERRESIAVFFRVLARLLRVQTQRNAGAAEVLALKVIREKNASLEKVLSWSDKPIIEFEALELMTALVGVNGAVAREFVRLFNFQSAPFGKLATRRMKKPDPPAVVNDGEGDNDAIETTAAVAAKPAFQIREAYVRLVLALTACPDKSVHRFAMKEGGVTASLFKSIDGDSVEMLSHLFERLKELVLHNTSVDDKTKLVIFNAHCVHQVLPLLQSDDDSIAQMALDVLHALFFEPTSALYVVPQKHALRLFLSKATASATVNPNDSDEPSHTSEQAYAVKVIRNAIVTIGVNEFIRSTHAQTLVASFFTTYPGLAAEYLQALSIQLEPKPGYRWFCMASLVQKLLSCPLDAITSGFPKESGADVPSWCSSSALATRLILPLNCRKELSRGIQHANNLIIYSALGIMEVALRRYQFLVSLAKSGAVSAIAPVELENELRFLLPSPEALVSLLLKLCSAVDQVALIYVRALVVFRLYLECLPQAMSEVKLDFTKILAWGYLETSSTNSQAPASKSALASLIVSEILRFLLTVDATRLHVLLPSGTVNNNSSNASRSKLLQLLVLYVQTPNQAIEKLCGEVLQRTLLVSTVFGNDTGGVGRSKEETAIWLDSLRTGGDKCAAFMEQLVQSVLADPFKYLETFRARSDANSVSLSLSPGTIALVTFFNQRAGGTTANNNNGNALAALRSDAQVVVFGTRVLLSLLSSAEAPQQLVSLITSVDAMEEDPVEAGSNDDEVVAKKRKCVDAGAIDGDAPDAYERLVQYCEALAGQSNVHPSKTLQPAQKKLKESTSSGHFSKWRDAKTVHDFVHQLLMLSPSSFVSSWEQIVDNCVRVSDGSFDIVFHYLDSWVGGNLVDVFQSHSTEKKAKKKDINVSSTGGRFKNELPLHIVLQSVFFTTSNTIESSGDALATLTALLKQRISNGSLTITEAVRLCEQLLFALSHRSTISTVSKTSGDSEEQLCNLLLHVLSFVIVSAKSVESAPLVSFQIARILRKLSKTANETSTSKTALGRKLSALEISGLRLFYSDGASSFTGTSFVSLLERCGIPSVVLLSSLLPADLRIRLLHKFLDASASTVSSVQGVLLQHLLKSLDDDNTATYASFTDYKKNKLLARKLWELLENTGSSRNFVRDSPLFYSSSFSVLGKLGGVQADVAHKAIGRTLVPIIVSAASSMKTNRVSLTEMLRRIMLAIRSESSVAAGGAFSRDFESQLVKKLKEKGIKTTDVSYSLLSAAYDVFTRIESPELLAYAHTLVGDCFASVMQSEQHQQQETDNSGEDICLSFLRHALLENNGSSDLTPVVSSVFKTLAKQYPDGKILSPTQQAALLLVMRSNVHQQETNSKTQETLIVFLVKCGLQALKTLSKNPNATTHEVEVTDKFLSVVATVVQGVLASGSVSSTTLVAIIKTLSPQFTRAQDFNYITLASYLGFVKMTAVFLTFVTADTSAREAAKYAFSDHLSVLTDHSLFVQSLEDKRHGEPLARVVYWLVQTSGVYDRKLFKVLLSVYGMSLSATDRLLRILFEKFDEHAGISLSQFGFRFGASSTTILSAAEDAVEPGQSRADLVDDSVWLISGGLEQTRIRATVEHFPLDREVATTSDLALLAFGSNGPDDEDNKLMDMDAKKCADRLLSYDPAFLLPMLSHFISSSDLPDAAIVQQGLLGIAVRATSSNADCIRTYAYGIVAHVHESLTSESSEFKAGRQIHLMLESFRNSIQEPLEGVSSVITVFMNDAISILCRPVHAMYPHLNHFLLARPAIDVNDVPMFYSLFNSRAPLTYKQERSWFLHTLRRGVCEDVDVMLLVRRHVLPILMSFFSSELADEHTQVLVGQILNSCLKTEGGASYLISKAAFFEWISALLLKQQQTVDKKTLLLLMELFANALQASEGLSDELDGPQQRALALQTVNAFAALCSSVQATRVTAALGTKLAHISELVMRFAQSACSLVTIQHVVDAVSSSVSFVDTAAGTEEHASNELSLELRDVKTNSVLSCMEAIVSEKLLQHPDLHKRSFGEWAGVLSQIADVLAAFIASGEAAVAAAVAAPVSNVAQRQRAKGALQSLKMVLDQVPSLKQLVLAKALVTKIAYVALL